jgi:hypothetical protein
VAFVIEIFLPLRTPKGARARGPVFEALKGRLVERFGGVTVFARTPAEGLWRDEGAVERDEIAVFEVMTNELDRNWWSALRRQLEGDLEQAEILIRAVSTDRL